MKKPNANIFRNAAKLIAEEKTSYACFAIQKANKLQISETSPEKEFFIDILKPNKIDARNAFYSYSGTENQNRLARTLGLLLMAEIVKGK